jgi:hypothetical protein
MVHALPPIEPDPSFVGQVLDRVRAWEAQEAGRGVGAPVRVPWPTRVSGSGLGERLREMFGVGARIGMGERLQGMIGFRALVSVRLAGAVVLGLAGGFVLGQQTLLPNRAASLPGLAERTTVSSPAVSDGGTGPVRSTSSVLRPFSDLAGDIPSVHAARGGADSVRVQPDDVENDPATYPGAIGSRQVLTTPGNARPRVTITDGRPQLTL